MHECRCNIFNFMDISIIVIGDELLIGQVTDTNSGWIARHIHPIGWNVKSIKVIGDNETEILKAIEECFAQTDLVLTTGGLGPTKDDITKEAMRKYFGGEMIFFIMNNRFMTQRATACLTECHLTAALTKIISYVHTLVIQIQTGRLPISP